MHNLDLAKNGARPQTVRVNYMFEIKASAGKRKVYFSSFIFECSAVFGISFLMFLLLPLLMGIASAKSRRINNDLINWIAKTYNEPNLWTTICIAVAVVSVGIYILIKLNRKYIVGIRLNEPTIEILLRNYFGNQFQNIRIPAKEIMYRSIQRRGSRQNDPKIEIIIESKSGKKYSLSNFSKFWDVKNDRFKIEELKSELEKLSLTKAKM